MTYRDHTLIGSGFLLGLKVSVQLSIICMPFIALMAFINIIASSSRLSIIIAILLFTLGTGLISYISSYISVVDLLFYLFPGEQIADVAGQQDTNFFNWLQPVLQSLMWIILAGLILRKRAL
jgi:hypothetical protein